MGYRMHLSQFNVATFRNSLRCSDTTFPSFGLVNAHNINKQLVTPWRPAEHICTVTPEGLILKGTDPPTFSEVSVLSWVPVQPTLNISH